MDAAQQQRVVGDEQVGPGCDGFVDDRQRRVDGEAHMLDRLIGVPRHQADTVPGQRRPRRIEAVKQRDDLAQRHCHVGPAGLEPTTPAV